MSLSSIIRPLRTARTAPLYVRSIASTSRVWNAAATEREHSLTEGESAIAAKLKEVFNPSKLDVEDVSGGCGTFYAITIQSSAFAGKNLVQQHRLVTKAIKEDIAGIHGLQLKTIPETSS